MEPKLDHALRPSDSLLRTARPRTAAVLALSLLLTACSSGIQSARSKVLEITPPPITGDLFADLEQCSRALERLNPLAKDPYSDLLRAAIYHRMHDLNAVEVYRQAEDVYRVRVPGVGAVLNADGGCPDLLAMSFRVVAALRARSGAIDDAELADWILVEKELAVADFLHREAGLGASPMGLRCGKQVPVEFVDLHMRAEASAMAAHFYQRAAKVASDKKLEDPRGLDGIRACCLDVQRAAAALAAWPGRDASFSALWKGVADRTSAVLADAEIAVWLSYGPHDAPIVFHFNLAGHLQEGRDLILRAEEERMGGRGERSLATFEEALRHFLFAWFLAPAEVRADRDRVPVWLDTIFASLHRLTWTGSDRERAVVLCVEKLEEIGADPPDPAGRLRLAAVLRRLHAARPDEVLANAGEGTLARCAPLHPFLAPPGPLARAGALAVAAWDWQGQHAGGPPSAVAAEDNAEAILAVADALVAVPAEGDSVVDRLVSLGRLSAALLVARRAEAVFVHAEGKSSPSALAAIEGISEALEAACAALRGESGHVPGLDRMLDDLAPECRRLGQVPETRIEGVPADWRPDAAEACREGEKLLAAARAEESAAAEQAGPASRLSRLVEAEAWFALAARLSDLAGSGGGPGAAGEAVVRAEIARLVPGR